MNLVDAFSGKKSILTKPAIRPVFPNPVTYMVARDFFEVLISYEYFSMMVLKVARKSIGERVDVAVLFITRYTVLYWKIYFNN